MDTGKGSIGGLTGTGKLTLLLRQWREGDEQAIAELAPIVYPELHALARGRVFRDGAPAVSPTELVHETFIRLSAQAQPTWANRAHFYYIAARLMRQILVDHARANRAEKRGGGTRVVSLDTVRDAAMPPSAGVLELHEALERLAEFDERKSRVMELRFFGGLTVDEISESLQIATATVTRDLRAATAWLRVWLSGQAS